MKFVRYQVGAQKGYGILEGESVRRFPVSSLEIIRSFLRSIDFPN